MILKMSLINFEGFRPNGLPIRIQRIFLHRIALVKIDFDMFLEFLIFVHKQLRSILVVKISYFMDDFINAPNMFRVFL